MFRSKVFVVACCLAVFGCQSSKQASSDDPSWDQIAVANQENKVYTEKAAYFGDENIPVLTSFNGDSAVYGDPTQWVSFDHTGKVIDQKPHDVWELESGQLLSAELARWAVKSNWTVVWELDYDVDIVHPAEFNGSFVDVVAQVAQAYANSTSPVLIRPVFYGSSRVVVMQSGEEEL
jgi:hypothetical protein